jgi:hypothetical protein
MQIEPGTSPKHRYELIKATLLVIIGALITITVVYGIDYFSPKQEPAPVAVDTVVENKPTETPAPTNPEDPKEKVYSQDELNKIFEMDKKKPGTKLFYSDNLGVGFTYIDNENPKEMVSIKEVDNYIYFDYPNRSDKYPKLEIFTKDPTETLDQAIAKEFLFGANLKDCFIINTSNSKKGYISAEISFRRNDAYLNDVNNYDSEENKNQMCPKKAHPYTITNGAQYFFMQPEKPSQYGFVRIGQDIGPLSGFPDIRDWSETIRFLK